MPQGLFERICPTKVPTVLGSRNGTGPAPKGTLDRIVLCAAAPPGSPLHLRQCPRSGVAGRSRAPGAQNCSQAALLRLVPRQVGCRGRGLICGFCRRPTELWGRKQHCPAALHSPHSHLTVVCRRGRCGPEQWAPLSGHSGDRLQAHSGPKECLARCQPS